MSHAGPPTRPDGQSPRTPQRASSTTDGTGAATSGRGSGADSASRPAGRAGTGSGGTTSSYSASDGATGASTSAGDLHESSMSRIAVRDISERQRAAALHAIEGDSWGRIAAFAGGITLGALIGAGAALLLAPASGFETRVELKRRARRMRAGAGDQWDSLGTELRRAARNKRNDVERSVTRGRWAAADFFDR